MRRWVSFVQILIGNALTAAAFGSVVIPRGFASGGTTGLSLILSQYLSSPLTVTVMAVNTLLFMAGFLVLGREFAAKTGLCVFSFPYMLAFFQHFALFPTLPSVAAAAAAGLLLGTGTLLILGGGGSAGGFDVIGLILSRRTGIPAWAVFYGIDAAIIFRQVLTGGIAAGICGIMVTLTACAVTAVVPVLIGSGRPVQAA